MADLTGVPLTFPWTKNFSISCSFWKFWQNRMLAQPEGRRPLLQGILDPPLFALNETVKQSSICYLNHKWHCRVSILSTETRRNPQGTARSSLPRPAPRPVPAPRHTGGQAPHGAPPPGDIACNATACPVRSVPPGPRYTPPIQTTPTNTCNKSSTVTFFHYQVWVKNLLN